MILENTFRFKLTFTECKTYEDVFGMLKYSENYFKTFFIQTFGDKPYGEITITV